MATVDPAYKSVEIPFDDEASTSAGTSVRARLTDVEKQTKAIYWVGVIGLIAIVVSVSAMVIDGFMFNHQTYRDSSQLNELQYQELTKKIELLELQLSSSKDNTMTMNRGAK